MTTAETANDPYSRQLPVPLQEMFREATLSAARGDLARAWKAVEGLRTSAPESLPAMLLASAIAIRSGRYREARALALRASRNPINVPELLLEAARWLRRYEEPEVLHRLVSGSDWRALGSPRAFAELALHLGSCGLQELARQCVDHGLYRHPGDPDLHYLDALLAMFRGDTALSIESCERALAARPGMPNTHLLLSMQDGKRDADRRIDAMQRALRIAPPGSEAEAYLCYSLHQRLDSQGCHEQAWRALSRGRAARRRMTPYARGEQDLLFRALKQAALECPDPRPAMAAHTRLIFIVGMFRSGTSLLERVLAGHPEVQDGGETYQFSAALREATDRDHFGVINADIAARAAAADFGAVRRRVQAYADWRAGGKRWLTEKLPSNFLNVGFILRAFPEAKILHMRREALDTCFSNLRTYFSGAAPYACDQGDLADYYHRYRDLMAHWHRWAPGRILDVDYASFVDDPEAQARRVMDYCGLAFAPDALDITRSGGVSATASAAQVRKGILKDRAAAWRPYERYLQPLIEGLRQD